MLIPSHLQKVIYQGLNKVKNDPNHHLNLGYREAIYWAFGPRCSTTKDSENHGYKRRIVLAKFVISHILPIWRQAWPQDDTVQNILAKIDRTINIPFYNIDRDSIGREIDDLWEYVVELTNETMNIAGVVGMAAVGAYSLAVWDGFTDIDETEIDFERTDDDYFMENDMHFYASSAYADGPPYSIALAPKSDTIKRRDFWEWWLTKAVPQAWESVPN